MCLIVSAIFYELRRAFFCLNVTDQLELWQLPFTAIDFNMTLKAPNSTIILFNCHKQRLIVVEFELKKPRTDCQLKLALTFSLSPKSAQGSMAPRRHVYHHHFKNTPLPKARFEIQKRKM